MEQDIIRMEGTVENVVFRSDDDGYTVLELDASGKLVTVVGYLGEVESGERLILEGRYVNHPRFGLQFSAEYCEIKLPDTVLNIEKYLSSGAVKGIGPSLARRIVSVFGEDTLGIMENTPERLMEVKGITAKKCDEITRESRKLFSLRILTNFLAQYEIKSRYAMRTYRLYGEDSPDIVRENPYVMCDPSIELDFSKADTIAAGNSIGNNSDIRIIAGMKYVLRGNTTAGHCCLPLDSLCKITSEAIKVKEKYVYDTYRTAIEKKELSGYIKNDREYAYLPEYYNAERYISDRIKLMREVPLREDTDIDRMIDIVEEENNIKYEAIQREAIKAAFLNGIMVLTGGPGTGKTTTLNAIISIFENMAFDVFLAAPTGRAAKRMTDLTGHDAKTIHRLLEVEPDSGWRPRFRHNEEYPLECDVLIVDEMSMVDVLLFESLLKAVRLGCRLILVGDSDQLPSVGAGNLLKDIIRSHAVRVIELKEIFRQSSDSFIVTNAHRIISGEYPDLTQKSGDFFFFSRKDYDSARDLIISLTKTRLPKAYNYSPTEDIQVITPTRKGLLGVSELNKVLQNELNPRDISKPEYDSMVYTFRIGDKVMQTKNNYDIDWRKDDEEGKGIYNGDIGKIINMDMLKKSAVIDFDGRVAVYPFEMLSQIELAYAITVHKSQGCEFEAVIIPIMGDLDKLFFRNLLYTAVTRAKKLLIIVGLEEKVKYMVDNNKRTNRYSCLLDMLSSDGENDNISGDPD